MGKKIELTASDGHRLGAYLAEPAGKPKAGLVVIQEIFGVNHHMRAVCDRLAEAGYLALAPALFDRSERDFECGYSPEEVTAARAFIKSPDWEAMLRDTKAAGDHLQALGVPLGIVGFCLGGSIAFLAATRLPQFKASVCYYGGQIARFREEVPQCPTLMHFGDNDQNIALADVDLVRDARPDCTVQIYPAGHGFNCDERGAYQPESAALAWRRTLEWLEAAFG